MMKKTHPHKFTPRHLTLWSEILDAAIDVEGEVDKRSVAKTIKELEKELAEYKQLAWFLHTAASHGIKIDKQIVHSLREQNIVDLRAYADGKTGNLKYWASVVKAYEFLEKHVKEMVR
jgi:hypothetical protein